MTLKTNKYRFLLTLSITLFCATSGALQAAASSGIESWYEARQQSLSAQNSNLGDLQTRADSGDADAQYRLGLIYQSGQGVPQSPELAQKLFERAAHANNAYAQYALALLLRSQGAQNGIKRSIQLQEQAAVNGHPEAQYGLGMLYANGQYVSRDLHQARHWLKQAGMRGNTMAELALKDLSKTVVRRQAQTAQPVQRPVSLPKARPAQQARQIKRPVPVQQTRPVQQVRQLQAATVRPATPVPVNMAKSIPVPRPVVKTPPKQPEKVAVEHNESQVNLDGMSVEQIHAAAKQGDRYAQLMLGALYEDGSEGVRQDYTAAMEWYLKSAQQGYPKAQHNLALLYEDGRGTKRNYRQAANWYKKAAKSGFSEAQNNLAVLYILGKGVDEDRSYAEKLLRTAVKQGNPNAKRNLAMLLEGEG